ncbi:MAG: glycosyl hydrolase family 18 protein, partial [Lachnospiraceae bacterium]
GDEVDTIAKTHQVPAEDIIYVNQLVKPYELAIGQALLIIEKRAEPTRGMIANGFAYPYISPWVLNQTLPFLQELSIFSYGFTEEGELLPPPKDDTWMIQAASDALTRSILTLTPLGRDGQFNNMLIHQLVNQEKAKQTLINDLITTMEEKGFYGVDIDFEYILPQDRDAFTVFVRQVADAVRPLGYGISVDLAPKTTAEQQGLLYQGKDYKALGEAADHVLVMTYEWGYSYGPPMAVAPIHKVREVIEYAVTEIPRAKINLGIPNYGYDWELPYIRGKTKAKTIGNVEAVRIAIHQSAVIEFDEQAQSPFFRYTEEGVLHEVWFEDVRSLRSKFNLMKEFHLRGAGYWQIMRFFRANWYLQEAEWA